MSETEAAPAVADTLPRRLFLSADGVGGWISVVIGAMAIAEGIRLGLGTLARMGPGAFPMGVGVGLLGLGAILLVNALRREGPLASIPFSLPILLILVSLGSFGVLLPMFGLAPASIVLMLICAYAVSGRLRLSDVVYAVLIAVACVLIFINGLGMVLPAVRWPF